MSLERELLTRAVMALDSEYSNELMDEIKELLAQPEPSDRDWYGKGYGDATLHFKREPLSNEEVFAIGYKAGFAIDSIERDLAFDYGFIDEDGDVDNEPYFKLVRAIEKAHGIGVDDETM